MKHENAIIILETNISARRNLLVSLELFIRRFELKIFILPALKRIMKKYDSKVYSTDSYTIDSLNKNNIEVIDLNNKIDFTVEENEVAKNISLKIAKNWYKQGNCADLLEFEGINFGAATETETTDIIYRIIKKIQIYERIMDNVFNDEVIYIENPYSVDGKIIKLICKNRGIKCFNVVPAFLGKIKSYFINKIKYNWYERAFINPVKLYRIDDNRKSNNISILVNTPYVNHLGAVFPVLEKLILKNYNIYIISKDTDMAKYESKHSFLNIETKKYKKEHKIMEIRFKKYFSQSNLGSSPIFNYNGMNIWKILKDDLYYSNKEKLAVLYTLKTYQRTVEIIKPAIIIVGDDRGPSIVRANLLHSLRERIPIVEVQHGIYTKNKPMINPISDKIFIWGEAMKVALINAGATEDQLEVTGSPLYDQLIDRFNNHSLKPLKSTKTVLFATQPVSGDVNIQIIREIASFLEDHEDITLIVKPHPSENASYYESSVKDFANDHIIVKDSNEDFSDMLFGSDVLIFISSTVGIEAAILGKPMICVNLMAEESVYISNGVALEVKDLKELATTIGMGLYDEEVIKQLSKCRDEFVYNYAYLKDGKASERIVDAIVKIIESKDDT